MKKQNQLSIRVENGVNGLDIFLNDCGTNHYIMTRRPNYLIWKRLKNGISLNELRYAKPRSPRNPDSARNEQKYYECTRYILRVVDSFIKHELAA